MLDILRERLRQGYRTLNYPLSMPGIPGRFAGLPSLDASLCAVCGIRDCLDACPSGAITMSKESNVAIDMGRCLFCRSCELACTKHAITFTHEHRMAAYQREALVISSPAGDEICRPGIRPALGNPKRKLAIFGKSLKLRQVSAGGCMACEADINVLGTLTYDLGRFGIEYAASPRHADGLIITGPVTKNMRDALLDTWDAVPYPKVIIAVGCCAISGGVFRDSGECYMGVEDVLPAGSVDVYIPGCPPHPWTILDGILSVAWKDANV